MTLEEENDPMLYANSSATSHVVNNSGMISSTQPYKGTEKLYVGNGEGLQITHIDEGNIPTKHSSLKLKNVVVVLNIKKNLLFVSYL